MATNTKDLKTLWMTKKLLNLRKRKRRLNDERQTKIIGSTKPRLRRFFTDIGVIALPPLIRSL